MKNMILNLIKGEEGVTALEYGLIASLIAVGIIASVKGLGTAVKGTFTDVAAEMTNPS
jgi:pilus assembly protein Flp/PilA